MSHVNPLMPLGGALGGTLPNPALSASAEIQARVFQGANPRSAVNVYGDTATVLRGDGSWQTIPAILGYTPWHAGNDGAGSGLDADLLDGQQGAYYAPIASPTFTGTARAAKLEIDDANFYLDLVSSNPAQIWNSGAYEIYDRTGNSWTRSIGSSARHQMGDGFYLTYASGVPSWWLVDLSQAADAKIIRFQNSVQDFIFQKVNDDFTTATELGRITALGKVYAKNAAPFGTKTTATNGAAAAAGTLLNAPAAGNPTKWVPFDDNGTTRYIPMW